VTAALVTIARAGSTLDRRYWLIAAGATVLALLVLGIPSAVIPNPFFVRMTPVEAFNIAVWVASAPLIGLVTATYLAPRRDVHPATADGSTRASLASIGAFLAIGCPICNKVVVAVLGVSGALSIFGPIQPAIGAVSVALLGATLVWRLRDRAAGCPRCVGEAAAQGVRPAQ
jgi:hypothetical protein